MNQIPERIPTLEILSINGDVLHSMGLWKEGKYIRVHEDSDSPLLPQEKNYEMSLETFVRLTRLRAKSEYKHSQHWPIGVDVRTSQHQTNHTSYSHKVKSRTEDQSWFGKMLYRIISRTRDSYSRIKP